jgi:hypothetical protein
VVSGDTEVAVAVHALNRMLAFGRPKSSALRNDYRG